MSQTIIEQVDNLAVSGLTVYTLKALDFVVPGEWDNLVGFEDTIRVVTEETDPDFIQQVAHRANTLYNDPNEGYQRAMWLYTTIDTTDAALATAALANKVGSKIPLFGSFLSRFTPKADTAQMIDLSLKIVVELVAFCYINGIPGDSVTDFIEALNDYRQEAMMRMAALTCIDGLLPLGPDFATIMVSQLASLTPTQLAENSTFAQIKDDIPGETVEGQLSFIDRAVGGVQEWFEQFVSVRDLNPQQVSQSIQSYVDIADDKLDYLGAFLDLTTAYYSHTGTQTIARRLIERAVNEI